MMYEPETLTQKEEKYKDKIQSDIHYCLNCQVRDSGDWIWIIGERYNLEDLFSDYDVPEKSRNKISSHLICQYCGTQLTSIAIPN